MRISYEKYYCPNQECEFNHQPLAVKKYFRFFHRIGTFITKYNGQPVPRYRCKGCKRNFSTHTFRSTYEQKKPYLNPQVYALYCSGMTQRRIAEHLGCNAKTVASKFQFLALEARKKHELEFTNHKLNCGEVQFDEMESFEHTRLKPVSIALAVSGDGKKIIEAQVGILNYKGRLTALAYHKYGPRIDTSKLARERTLKFVATSVESDKALRLVTDAKPQYTTEIKQLLGHFQGLTHRAVKNRKNRTLFSTNPTRRKNVKDEMFWLNHVAGRIRHDMSRMMRKVWTTTKKVEYLEAHLNLFIAYYNGYKLFA